MNFLILGSGFGIYGYLPAIYKNSKKIFLNIKYKKKIEKRIELIKYLKRVIWYLDIKDINNKIDYIIIAQNPKKQFLITKKILKLLKPKHLFLEKPLSYTPNKSLNFVEFLKKNKIKFSVGYLFTYLSWYKYIEKKLTYNQKFQINWKIKFNKKNNLWKSNHHEGGGLVRFYCIHFFKLLYDLNLTKIHKVSVNKKNCKFIFKDQKENIIFLNIEYALINQFYIIHNKNYFLKASNPFMKSIKINNDPRVNIIQKYVKDIFDNFKINYAYEKKFIKFWKKIEMEI
jgi:predicted dehydrogenase